MQLNKLLCRRLVAEVNKHIIREKSRTNFGSNLIVRRELHTSEYKAMAQTNITSFFKFTPLKSTITAAKKDEDAIKEETSASTSKNTEKVVLNLTLIWCKTKSNKC